MSKFNILFKVVVLLFISYNSFAQNDTISKISNNFQSDSLISIISNTDSIKSVDTLTVLSDKSIYNPQRDPKRLLYNTGMYAGVAVASFGLLWVAPVRISKWDKEEIKDEGLINKWKENVKTGPTFDEDDFYMNYIVHPWAGGVYYMTARGSGYKPWESFTYSFLMSTFFWEYGVEAFAEVPSFQDLVITPVVGSIVGEGFFIAKGKIIKNDRRVLNSKFLGNTTLFVMDPFNEMLDILGYNSDKKVVTYSSFLPIERNRFTGKQTWGMQVVVKF
jgi:hypothetical protein